MIYEELTQEEIERDEEICPIYLYPTEFCERLNRERNKRVRYLNEIQVQLQYSSIARNYHNFVNDQIHLMYAVQQSGIGLGHDREWGKELIERLEELQTSRL